MAEKIEKGDLFIVTRGYALNIGAYELFSGFGGPSIHREQIHDRSHEGKVYRAKSVAGDSIVSEKVWPPKQSSYEEPIGTRSVINQREVVTQKVDAEYLSELEACEVQD